MTKEEEPMFLKLLEKKKKSKSLWGQEKWIGYVATSSRRGNTGTYADFVKDTYGAHASICIPTTRLRT
jgi:hypothetical protein